MKRSHIIFLIITTILIIDQSLKLYVKSHFHYNESVNMLGLSWAQLRFAENEGMAFGLAWGGVTGKYILSILRIFMVGFLFYFIGKMVKANEAKGFIASFALIIAGAIGNILDSLYFGLIFNESSSKTLNVAEFLSEEGGYAPFLQGKVVDMLHFPMIKSHYPEWFPFNAGKYFEFFSPIFNIADSSIFIGVVCILIFYRKKIFQKENNPSETASLDPA